MYPEKRAAQVPYAACAARGYPRGSGSVESTNGLVVEVVPEGDSAHLVCAAPRRIGGPDGAAHDPHRDTGVLKKRQTREYGEYRAKRLVLAAWDALHRNWRPASLAGR